jgi:hypothetical protein
METAMKRLLIGAALLAAMPGMALGADLATAFKIGDLGETPSRRICMSVAAQVLVTYIDKFGGHPAVGNIEDAKSWSFYGWDLRPGDNDVVITCPIVAGQANAFYTIHSSGDDADANATVVAERLRDLWKELF